jgi:hypothetical protein
MDPLQSEDVSEQGIQHPCRVPHDILDGLHVSQAGLPQGWLVLTTSGQWWGGAPTRAQCLTHIRWGAKSADRSSSLGVRESVRAVLIVWVPPALPSTRGTFRFVHVVSLWGNRLSTAPGSSSGLTYVLGHGIPFARALNYGK